MDYGAICFARIPSDGVLGRFDRLAALRGCLTLLG
jgi:hypothetical protein